MELGIVVLRSINSTDSFRTAHLDEGSQCYYYYNTLTKESTWDKPASFVGEEQPIQ